MVGFDIAGVASFVAAIGALIKLGQSIAAIERRIALLEQASKDNPRVAVMEQRLTDLSHDVHVLAAKIDRLLELQQR